MPELRLPLSALSGFDDEQPSSSQIRIPLSALSDIEEEPKKDDRSWLARAIDSPYAFGQFEWAKEGGALDQAVPSPEASNPLDPTTWVPGVGKFLARTLAGSPGDLAMSVAAAPVKAVGALRAVPKVLRAVDALGSGAMAARGAERLANAESMEEAAAGALQGGLGYLGARSALVPTPTPSAAGRLTPRVVTESVEETQALLPGLDPDALARFPGAETVTPSTIRVPVEALESVAVTAPSETGAISGRLLARGGGGTAGALYGAASGEDTEDRLKRAVIFGTAGALAPSLIPPGAGPGRLAAGAIDDLTPAGAGGAPAPLPLSKIRARAIDDPMAGVDVLIRKFPEELQTGIKDRLVANGGFAAQRRGVIPRAETERLAEMLAVDTARTLPAGTALNAETLRAYANTAATIQKKVNGLAAKVTAGTNTDLDIVALTAAQAEHTAVMASLMGARAEAGRALASFNLFAKVLETGNPNLVREAAKGLKDDALKLSQEMGKHTDPLDQYRFLQSQAKSSWPETGRSVFYANMLSGVKTHERNLIGNMANTVSNLVTTPFAAAADAARVGLRGGQREVFAGEVPHQLVGTVGALPQAFSDMLFTLKNGVSRAALTKSVSLAESAGKFDLPRVELRGGGANPFNYPGRALDAMDGFFRTLNKQQELYGGAFAQAKREGHKGDALAERMAELRVGDSPEALKLQQGADTFATRAVFQEKLGGFGQVMQQVSKYVPFIVPFVKTPANILRQGMEFSPTGFAQKAARQGGRAGSQAQGRAALGTLVLAPLAYLASTGRLSGSGPQDRAERAALMESGWRPNSVKISLGESTAQSLGGAASPAGNGEYWVSYQLFQPMAVPASIMANGFDAWREAGSKGPINPLAFAEQIARRTGRSVLDNSFLSGLSDFMEAFDSEDQASAYFSRLAHTALPFSGAQRTVREVVDPVVRQPETFGERVAAQVPGLSQDVPPRLSRFGEPVVTPGGPLKRAADPFNVSPEVADPVAGELKRLGVDLGLPSARLTVTGDPLSREQEEALKAAKGQAIRTALVGILENPRYAGLDDERKRLVLERVIERTQRTVSAQTRGKIQHERRRSEAATSRP